VKGLSAVSFLNDFASEMIYPLLPAFVTRTLGGGAVVLGALDGAADLTASLIRVVSGRWADRPGWQRPLILAGYGIATAVRPLIGFAGSAWQVVAARVTDRVGKGLRSPARDALIAQVTPFASRGRAFGFQRAADHLGAVAGSLVAWLLLSRGVEVRSVILWSVAPGLAAMVVLMRVLSPRLIVSSSQRPIDASSPNEPSADPPIRRSADFWIPIGAMTLLLVSRIPETLLLLRLQDLGVAVSVVPLVWAGLHVVRTVGAYPGGWLSDRIGPRAMLAAGAVLFGAVLLGLARPLSAAMAVLVFLILGLVTGLSEASDRQVVAALSAGGAGRAFGNAQALAGVAALPAGLGFGAVFQGAGGPMALKASASATALALVIWLVTTRRNSFGPRRSA
jgi:MFS family permease